MEIEKRITAPEGCEIEKVKIVDGVAVVTFKPQERKLPKSWEEFCDMFTIQGGECYIDNLSDIRQCVPGWERRIGRDKCLLPDYATAEAVLAMCQLIQLRNYYNGGWVPDWTDDEAKFVIQLDDGEFVKDYWNGVSTSFLYFKSDELRDEFLRNFRPLIEKLKPLYGIKEGGEE